MVCRRRGNVPFYQVGKISVAGERFDGARIRCLHTLPTIRSIARGQVACSHSFRVDYVHQCLSNRQPDAVFASTKLDPTVVKHGHIRHGVTH